MKRVPRIALTGNRTGNRDSLNYREIGTASSCAIGEARVKRGGKFGNQIQSPDRQRGVGRFDAPHPPAATLPLWLRLVRVSVAVPFFAQRGRIRPQAPNHLHPASSGQESQNLSRQSFSAATEQPNPQGNTVNLTRFCQPPTRPPLTKSLKTKTL